MISSLDYLDYDVSNVLSEYINIRRNHDNVIQDIDQLININICSEYLKSFDAFGWREYPYSHPVSGKERLKYANYLLTSDRKTNLLHNWPTKYPKFYTNKPVIRGNMPPQVIIDTLIRVSNEDYIIKETNWRLKRFPPDKNKYSINQLLMLK